MCTSLLTTAISACERNGEWVLSAVEFFPVDELQLRVAKLLLSQKLLQNGIMKHERSARLFDKDVQKVTRAIDEAIIPEKLMSESETEKRKASEALLVSEEKQADVEAESKAQDATEASKEQEESKQLSKGPTVSAAAKAISDENMEGDEDTEAGREEKEDAAGGLWELQFHARLLQTLAASCIGKRPENEELCIRRDV